MSSCCKYIDNYLMPYVDFLHSPTSFPLTKKATKSYFGIFLSFTMISIFCFLVFKDYSNVEKDYSVSYSQEFIKGREWSQRNITLGFNISEDMINNTEIELEDSSGEKVELKSCNENLIESENGPFNCIVNYSLKINNSVAHVLKLKISKKDNVTYPRRIPFSLAIKEPKIQHDNPKNPLDTESNASIDQFRCFFDTTEITSYRRYLRAIAYTSEGGFLGNKIFNSIYLDDYEDSRKTNISEKSGNLLGTYRIMVSKKVDIYSRKYIKLKEFLSKIGGYLSLLMTFFSTLCTIFVNPNDNYRIFDYLKKKRSKNLDVDLKSIYEDTKIKKKLEQNDFNLILTDNRWFVKSWYKFCNFFCRCCNKCYKRVEPIKVINQYIEDNLTIENYLETQILSKKLIKNKDKMDDLRAKHLNKFKKRKSTDNDTNENENKEMQFTNTNQPLISYDTIEIDNNNQNNLRKGSTIYIENATDITSFNEKQKEDIIKIVLMELFQ